MRFYTILLLNFIIIFISCNGQNNQVISVPKSNNQSTKLSIGETVNELDKTIWTIYQDKKSNYWFGSKENGVFYYNGQKLKQFTIEDGLVSNEVRGIQEDKFGNIFISSLGGINKFDGEKFTTLPVIESNDWKLDSNDLWFYMLGKTGESGVYRYDGNTVHHLKFPKHYMEDEYYKVNGKHPWSPYDPYTIYKDRIGNIWFGTAEFGVCRYDGTTLSWLYEKHLTLIEGGGSFGIRSIIEDKEGNFWFCNSSYRYKILPASLIKEDKVLIDYKREKGIENVKSPDGKDKIYFMSVTEDDKGDLWMLTYEQGVWRYNGKTITQYEVKDNNKDIKLFSIYKDNNGYLWLGTHENGAYKFNGTSFEKFKPY
ncbi:MAG: hypothetical protein NWQ15_02645 [Flavobacterium sp.]|nr:hypothetical protein [Flavobacterium sp.]